MLRFIWTFNNFDDIYLLTGGGSGTQVVAVRVYDFLISRGNIGTAAAQALVLAVDPRGARHRLPQALRTVGGGRHDHRHRHPPAPRRRRRASREMVERRILGVLRPIVIVLLLVAAVFPFYYMVVLSFRPLDAVLQDPGALLPKLSEINLATYTSVLQPVEDGGQGFLVFLRNSLGVSLGTVVLTLLVSLPGAYAVSRLQFFGRRQIGACSSGSTSSRRSCWPSRCSASTARSGCAGRSSGS